MRCLKFLLLLLALPTLGQQTNRFPINRGVLQTDMDAAGKSITNAQNFVAGWTGQFIGNGAGLTNVAGGGGGSLPGRNMEASGATLSTITNPVFTTLTVSNPAPASSGGSIATLGISGNQAQGGFGDSFQSSPSTFSLNLGGSGRFFVSPSEVIQGTSVVSGGLTTSGVNSTNGAGTVTISESGANGQVFGLSVVASNSIATNSASAGTNGVAPLGIVGDVEGAFRVTGTASFSNAVMVQGNIQWAGKGSGDLSGGTNLPSSVLVPSTNTVNPFAPNAYGSGSNFVWMATAGRIGNGAPRVGLWTSLDGTNWNKSKSSDVYTPDEFTNAIVGFQGPQAWRWQLFFTNGLWWACAPHDYASTNAFAQGVDIWKSSDLTNWNREIVIYPVGTTNTAGRVFSTSWFRDTDQSAWMIFSAQTNLSPGNTLIYSMHALDNSMTNWGAVNVIKTNDVTQDAVMARANGVYYLFYRCRWPALEYLRATNNNLTTPFVLAPDAAGNIYRGTNWGWGAFGNSASAGQLSLLNIGGTKWRAYLTDESLVAAGNATTVSYLDSPDDMATWSANWTTVTTLTNYYSCGVALAPAAATNQLYAVGQTNLGSVAIQTALLRAGSVQANDLSVKGGVAAGSFFSPGSISTLNTVQADSLILNPSGGTTLNGNIFSANAELFTVSAGNFLIDSSGNTLMVTLQDGTRQPMDALGISVDPLNRLLVGAWTAANSGNQFAGTFTNTASAGSRIQITDANGKIKDSTASGAVPIDANGTAATFAQINALASGNIVTQGNSFAMTFSNSLAVDKGHAFSPSNSTPSRVAMIGSDNSLTNASATSSATTLVAADGSPVTAGANITIAGGTIAASGGGGADATAWHQNGDNSGTIIGPTNGTDLQFRMTENGGNGAVVAELITYVNSDSVNFKVGSSNSFGSSGFGENILGTHNSVGNGVTWPTIAGGGFNSIGANGNQAFIGGGASNQANGAYSVALGQKAIAANDNSFVFNGIQNLGLTTSGGGGDNGKILWGGTGFEFTNSATTRWLNTGNGITFSNTPAANNGVFYQFASGKFGGFYAGTNWPGNGKGTDLANGAIAGTNLIQIDAPTVAKAIAVDTNGNTYISTLNARSVPRITSITSSATPSVNSDITDCVTITAQAADITSMTSSLTGTPNNFDQLEYRIKDNGTSRAITWGASFASGPATLPTATTISKALHAYFEWDSVQSKWLCMSTGSDQ